LQRLDIMESRDLSKSRSERGRRYLQKNKRSQHRACSPLPHRRFLGNVIYHTGSGCWDHGVRHNDRVRETYLNHKECKQLMVNSEIN
jgi:hypothetical protein